MADVRIHDLPSAASWNGFFPQDKPGGPTECVSVATVEAKLVEDGFVKTSVLVAGYQPLENQRLRTTDSPTFAAATLSGIKVLPEFTYPTTDTAIYGKNITPTALNWGAWFANDGTLAGLNADNIVTLAIDGVSRVSVNAGAVNIATKLQIAGVDRITNAGGFVGTSLQISGATANKLARFDASKNLVSYDLVAGDIPDYFVRGNGVGPLGHRTTNLGSVTTIPATQSGFADVTAGDGPQGAVLSHLIRNQHQGGGPGNLWSLDISAPFAGSSGGTEAYYVRLVSNGSTAGWRQLWHSGSPTIIAGAAKIGTGAIAANHARFGHSSFDLSAGYGYVQNPTGGLYMDAPTGEVINLGINGVSILATNATRVNISNKLQIAGVDRITNAGGFVGTSLQISGTSTLTGGIVGTTSGASAASGIVGEILSAYASGTSFTNTTAGVVLASLSLPAGSWLVWASGHVASAQNPTGVMSFFLSYSSTAGTAIDATTSFSAHTPSGSTGVTCLNSQIPINISSAVTIYLQGAQSGSGTPAINNGSTIFAQRIR